MRWHFVEEGYLGEIGEVHVGCSTSVPGALLGKACREGPGDHRPVGLAWASAMKNRISGGMAKHDFLEEC